MASPVNSGFFAGTTSGLLGDIDADYYTRSPETLASGPEGAPGNNDFPVGFFCQDYVANEVAYVWVATVAATLSASCAGSYGIIGTNPTGTVLIALSHFTGGSWAALGNISISTAGVITWPAVALTTIAAGEGVRFVMPASLDATLANFVLALKLTKVT